MTIPQKHFYTIGDVCSLTGTKPHVLRYWESKFKLLRPARRYSGHRKFTPEDIDLINRIRYLIVERKFTLTGAKKEIQKQMGSKNTVRALSLSPETLAVLRDLQKDVDDCLSLVKPARAASTHVRQQELLQI